MKTKKVLIICPFFRPNIGGVETHLNLLTQYLSQYNFQTTVLTYKPITTETKNYLKIEKTKNLKIYRFWWFGQKIFDKTTPFPFLQFIYIIPGLFFHTLIFLKKNHSKIDVIHAHGFAAAFIVRVCSLFFKLPQAVVSTHYIYPNLNPQKLSTKILKWTFNGFNKILLVSQKSGDQLHQLGIDQSKMVLYKHWLNPKIYHPIDKDYSQISVLFVGRIIAMKGVFRLLEVAKKLPKINFTIIGDGPDFQLLYQKAKDQKNFTILGKKTPSEIIPYYQNHQLTIIPSIAPEAQPMVVMESLMCGTPLITTNIGSIIDMYPDTVGLKIIPTVSNIIKSINFLVSHPDKMKNMSTLSREFAITSFSDKNAQVITKSYQL
jgi:phosphatidylinositol glycan class A protein